MTEPELGRALQKATVMTDDVIIDIQPVVAAYSVCALPSDNIYHDNYEVKVELTDPQRNMWAVRQMGRCLNSSGEWDYEMLPSARKSDWLAEHRFQLRAAIDAALRAAPDVVVNGISVSEALSLGGAS